MAGRLPHAPAHKASRAKPAHQAKEPPQKNPPKQNPTKIALHWNQKWY